MRSLVFAPLAALALLAASPSSSVAQASAARTATVICAHTPFFEYPPGSSLPRRAPTPEARQGQTFEVRGKSVTLSSTEYIETNVPVVDSGYGPNAHYWLLLRCVSLS